MTDINWYFNQTNQFSNGNRIKTILLNCNEREKEGAGEREKEIHSKELCTIFLLCNKLMFKLLKIIFQDKIIKYRLYRLLLH